jgi:hypothetical protein
MPAIFFFITTVDFLCQIPWMLDNPYCFVKHGPSYNMRSSPGKRENRKYLHKLLNNSCDCIEIPLHQTDQSHIFPAFSKLRLPAPIAECLIILAAVNNRTSRSYLCRLLWSALHSRRWSIPLYPASCTTVINGQQRPKTSVIHHDNVDVKRVINIEHWQQQCPTTWAPDVTSCA